MRSHAPEPEAFMDAGPMRHFPLPITLGRESPRQRTSMQPSIQLCHAPCPALHLPLPSVHPCTVPRSGKAWLLRHELGCSTTVGGPERLLLSEQVPLHGRPGRTGGGVRWRRCADSCSSGRYSRRRSIRGLQMSWRRCSRTC